MEQKPRVPPAQVAERAHRIWESEGRPEGAALDHWLRAEAELAAEGPKRRSAGKAGRAKAKAATSKKAGGAKAKAASSKKAARKPAAGRPRTRRPRGSPSSP
jgi:hypothetical protein